MQIFERTKISSKGRDWRTLLGSALLILATGLFTASCSGDLEVIDSSGKEISGVPISAEEIWVAEGVYTRLSKGGTCDQTTPFQKLVSLATGATYYLRPKMSVFSKTNFSVKLGDGGVLRELTFNSESVAGDTMRGANELLKSALPALGVVGAGAPSPSELPACDTGERFTKLTRFADWVTSH
jgi:hypothetical protein